VKEIPLNPSLKINFLKIGSYQIDVLLVAIHI